MTKYIQIYSMGNVLMMVFISPNWLNLNYLFVYAVGTFPRSPVLYGNHIS